MQSNKQRRLAEAAGGRKHGSMAGQGNRVKKESSSFLKKRTKKLLLIGRAPAARARE
jgi:hypothetical protein